MKRSLEDIMKQCDDLYGTSPKFVGVYVVGSYSNGYAFPLRRKPSITHRFFMKLLLGFVWADYE